MYSSTDLLTIFFILMAIASFVAYQAHLRGKSPILWFVIGFAFGLIAPILLLFFTTPKVSHPKEGLNQRGDNGFPTMKVSLPDPSLKEEEKIEPPKRFDLTEDIHLWYYLDDKHTQEGPVSIVALRELVNRGMLSTESYVWTKGMEEWKKIEELPDLKKACFESDEDA